MKSLIHSLYLLLLLLLMSNSSFAQNKKDLIGLSFGASNFHIADGWTLNYPCTLTTTPDGKSPEGIGIIPDVALENTKADVLVGNDKVLEFAIKHLLK